MRPSACSGKKMKQTKNKKQTTRTQDNIEENIVDTKRFGIFSSLFLTHCTDDNKIYFVFFCFITKRVRHAHANEKRERETENIVSRLYTKKEREKKNEK